MLVAPCRVNTLAVAAKSFRALGMAVLFEQMSPVIIRSLISNISSNAARMML
jgi:hypothetical protein